jgi:hypothetical protein
MVDILFTLAPPSDSQIRNMMGTVVPFTRGAVTNAPTYTLSLNNAVSQDDVAALIENHASIGWNGEVVP